MKFLDSTNTSGRDGIAIGLIDWWLFESKVLLNAVDHLAETPDEFFEGLSDRSIGRAINKAVRFWENFEERVSRTDTCEGHMFLKCRPDTLRDWMFESVGQEVKSFA